MTKYRLLAPAQLDGAHRLPGYIFELPEGVRGPHKSVQKSPDLHAASMDTVSQQAFQGKYAGDWEDIPLFEEVREE